VGGNEDVDGDLSGEEAAWRDLVARFDQPADTAEPPPWPAREDLTDAASGRPRPERDSAVGGGAGRTGLPGRPGPASLPGTDFPGAEFPAAGLPGTGLPGTGLPGGGEDAPPATPPAGDGPRSPDPRGPDPFGPAFFGPDPFSPDAFRSGSAARGGGAAGPGTGAGPADARRDVPPGAGSPPRGGRHASGRPGEGARIVRRAGAVPPPSPAGDDADEDGRYIPPPPEPLPKLDSTAKAAWTGLLGGPAYLVVSSLLGKLSNLGALLAIVAFIGGGVTLFLRMSDRPRDEDDDGAVV
jgi:hypothetical protein